MDTVLQSASPDSHGRSHQPLYECRPKTRSMEQGDLHPEHGEEYSRVLDSPQNMEVKNEQLQNSYHSPEENYFQVGELPQFLLDTEFDIENGLSDTIPADILSLLEPCKYLTSEKAISPLSSA